MTRSTSVQVPNSSSPVGFELTTQAVFVPTHAPPGFDLSGHLHVLAGM